MPVVRHQVYSASVQIVSNPCQLYHVFGWRGVAGGPRWMQIHDAVGLPANGTAPKLSFLSDAIDLGTYTPVQPLQFANGVYLVVSSTGDTLTVAAGEFWAELWLNEVI